MSSKDREWFESKVGLSFMIMGISMIVALLAIKSLTNDIEELNEKMERIAPYTQEQEQ